MIMKLFLSMALLLAGSMLAASAAPKKSSVSPQAKSAQVDAIVSATVDNLWAQTDVYWHHGDYPRIVGLDRIIVQADPHFLESYETGGWLLESMGKNQDAEAFYQLGIANNPHVSYAYYGLGFFYFNTMHNYPSAVAVFQKDTKTPDASVLDWRMLAHSYERTGDWGQAVATWREIKHRWPNGAPNDLTHGGVDDKNLREALAHLQSAGTASGKTPMP